MGFLNKFENAVNAAGQKLDERIAASRAQNAQNAANNNGTVRPTSTGPHVYGTAVNPTTGTATTVPAGTTGLNGTTHSGTPVVSNSGFTGPNSTTGTSGSYSTNPSSSTTTTSHNPLTGSTTAHNSVTGNTASHNPLTGNTTTRNEYTGETIKHNDYTGKTTSYNPLTGDKTTHNERTGEAVTRNEYTGNTTSHNPLTGNTTTRNEYTGEAATRNEYTGNTTSHTPVVGGINSHGNNYPSTHNSTPTTGLNNGPGYNQHYGHHVGGAVAVPQPVIVSQERAHVPPEASANPIAVNEKSYVEQELLAKVHTTEPAIAGTDLGALNGRHNYNGRDSTVLPYHNNSGRSSTVTGLQPGLENPSAIPTAGGQKVGTGVDEPETLYGARPRHEYGGSPQTDGHYPHHHDGRNAALAGTAAGIGAHELGRTHHGEHNHHLGNGATSNGYGTSDYNRDHHLSQNGHNSHLGRDAALGVGAGTAAGIGAHELGRDHHTNSNHVHFPDSPTSNNYNGYNGNNVYNNTHSGLNGTHANGLTHPTGGSHSHTNLGAGAAAAGTGVVGVGVLADAISDAKHHERKHDSGNHSGLLHKKDNSYQEGYDAGWRAAIKHLTDTLERRI